MLFKNSILYKVLAVSAMAMIVHPAYAAPSRGMRAAESLESRDVPAVANVIDGISSLIGDASSLNDDDLLAKFIAQSSAPTHDSMHGSCVQAEDDVKLRMLINNASVGDTILLCPGKIHFNSAIVLTKSITISCAGPTGSCILNGNESTRHFFSDDVDVTLAFIDLTFINGFTDDGSINGPFGGSLRLFKASTIILTGCVFYNNRATSSSFNAFGGAIYASQSGGETVVNNCLFLDNVAVTTNANYFAFGGAIRSAFSNLKVMGSIFKNNKALQDETSIGGGGAIDTFGTDVLVLSSVFELNEAIVGGAARFFSPSSVDWYNNKDLLFGNDASVDCDGVDVVGEDCFNVGDNFSV